MTKKKTAVTVKKSPPPQDFTEARKAVLRQALANGEEMTAGQIYETLRNAGVSMSTSAQGINSYPALMVSRGLLEVSRQEGHTRWYKLAAVPPETKAPEAAQPEQAPEESAAGAAAARCELEINRSMFEALCGPVGPEYKPAKPAPAPFNPPPTMAFCQQIYALLADRGPMNVAAIAEVMVQTKGMAGLRPSTVADKVRNALGQLKRNGQVSVVVMDLIMGKRSAGRLPEVFQAVGVLPPVEHAQDTKRGASSATAEALDKVATRVDEWEVLGIVIDELVAAGRIDTDPSPRRRSEHRKATVILGAVRDLLKDVKDAKKAKAAPPGELELIRQIAELTRERDAAREEAAGWKYRAERALAESQDAAAQLEGKRLENLDLRIDLANASLAIEDLKQDIKQEIERVKQEIEQEAETRARESVSAAITEQCDDAVRKLRTLYGYIMGVDDDAIPLLTGPMGSSEFNEAVQVATSTANVLRNILGRIDLGMTFSVEGLEKAQASFETWFQRQLRALKRLDKEVETSNRYQKILERLFGFLNPSEREITKAAEDLGQVIVLLGLVRRRGEAHAEVITRVLADLNNERQNHTLARDQQIATRRERDELSQRAAQLATECCAMRVDRDGAYEANRVLQRAIDGRLCATLAPLVGVSLKAPHPDDSVAHRVGEVVNKLAAVRNALSTWATTQRPDDAAAEVVAILDATAGAVRAAGLGEDAARDLPGSVQHLANQLAEERRRVARLEEEAGHTLGTRFRRAAGGLIARTVGLTS